MDMWFSGNITKLGTKKKEKTMIEEVQKALDVIRPALQADGGNVELVEVTGEGVVKVKLLGACGHCPMSTMTLKMGIERTLKEKVPGVTEVISV
jgi:Fe-S cluster biogenesis protein NfuA